jgi:hypothetical protein
MSDSLETYLQDHLAGAAYAIDLVEFMRDQHRGDELGRFASEILIEIKQDRATLREIAERVGTSGGSTLKEAASWAAEKVSRFKLGHDAGSGLATFEGLEFLTIGILGKRALWRALAAIATYDPRLTGVDFDALAARAQKQHDLVDQRRLMVARTALGRRSESSRPAPAYNQDASTQTNGGFTMRKTTVAGSIAVTLGVLLAVALLPDFIRYMKIRAM